MAALTRFLLVLLLASALSSSTAASSSSSSSSPSSPVESRTASPAVHKSKKRRAPSPQSEPSSAAGGSGGSDKAFRPPKLRDSSAEPPEDDGAPLMVHDADRKSIWAVVSEEDKKDQKRVEVQSFKGQTYVHIRTYYPVGEGKDKDYKPSPKGIALTKEEFMRVCALQGQVLKAFGTMKG